MAAKHTTKHGTPSTVFTFSACQAFRLEQVPPFTAGINPGLDFHHVSRRGASGMIWKKTYFLPGFRGFLVTSGGVLRLTYGS
jgi:hypothetical protein